MDPERYPKAVHRDHEHRGLAFVDVHPEVDGRKFRRTVPARLSSLAALAPAPVGATEVSPVFGRRPAVAWPRGHGRLTVPANPGRVRRGGVGEGSPPPDHAWHHAPGRPRGTPASPHGRRPPEYVALSWPARARGTAASEAGAVSQAAPTLPPRAGVPVRGAGLRGPGRRCARRAARGRWFSEQPAPGCGIPEPHGHEPAHEVAPAPFGADR